ncbi:TetR/AcrR family transcriptional regulator [Nonomuraea sp. NPDC050451]|uniref:TetR/AcrR family transcriptional regulator n=1 Tax=Nonomuraea sp. NPDC050451 TaxID=3364364 RepID=UPI00378A5F45
MLEAAILVFAGTGWKEATYDAIGARAGVTRGAVHHHFRDKTRLLEEAISAAWRRHAAPALSEPSCEDRPARRLAGFLSRYLRLLSQDESFRALAVVSVLVAPQVVDVGEGMRENTRETDQWAALIIPLLESGTGVRAGLRPPDVLFAVMAFLRGVTVTAATAPQDLPEPEASASIARAIVAGLMQDEEEP